MASERRALMAEHRQVPLGDVFVHRRAMAVWPVAMAARFLAFIKLVMSRSSFSRGFFTLIFAVFVGYAIIENPLPLLIVLYFFSFTPLVESLLRPLIFNLIFISVFLMLYSHQRRGIHGDCSCYCLESLGQRTWEFCLWSCDLYRLFHFGDAEHLFARQQGNAATARRRPNTRGAGRLVAYLFVFINPYGRRGFISFRFSLPNNL